MSNTLETRGSKRWIEHKELRVEIEDQWGWLDRLILFPQIGHALLFDLKTGRYSVDPAEDNLQMWGYTIGIWDTFDFIKTIEPHIIIPRRNEASHCLFNRNSDYDRLKTEVFKVIENARLQGGKVFHPGWVQCRFCNNKTKCLALAEFASQIVPRYNEEFVIPNPIHPSEITDIQTLDRAFLLAKVLEKWFDSLKFHMTNLAREGFEFEHFKLVEITGKRKITNTNSLWDILRAKNWNLNTFLECCEIKMETLDEKVAAQAPHGQKGRAKQALTIELQDANVLEVGKPTYQMKTKPN